MPLWVGAFIPLLTDLATDFKRSQDCIDVSGISSNFCVIGKAAFMGSYLLLHSTVGGSFLNKTSP